MREWIFFFFFFFVVRRDGCEFKGPIKKSNIFRSRVRFVSQE